MWRVARFWDSDFLSNPDGVADGILADVGVPRGPTHPRPLPFREGGRRGKLGNGRVRGFGGSVPSLTPLTLPHASACGALPLPKGERGFGFTACTGRLAALRVSAAGEALDDGRGAGCDAREEVTF